MSFPASTKVCVIGAGTMGSGIAALLANLGFQVTLLDQTAASAKAGLDRARNMRPPHFYSANHAESIRVGGIDENLDWVREADWVCEAIIEKLDAKKNLYALIEPLVRPEALVSTNTSGLQIELLIEGRSDDFCRKFVGTHFFNPPRYLKLLELIPTSRTDTAILQNYVEFLEEHVARRVVLAKDTPGFIANRYGMWSMFHATHIAEKLQLPIEAVDAITGPFLGRPRSGSFRLNDLVGMDIMVDIAANLRERCPQDPRTDALATPKSIEFLLSQGHLGAKSGMGFYRKEGKELLALDLTTHAYRQQLPVSIPSLEKFAKMPLGERIRATLTERDEAAEFLRLYLIPTLRYAEELRAEISHSVEDFDRVMMWGFGWEMGPFALIDAIGRDALGWSEAPPNFQGKEQLDFTGIYVNRKVEPQFATIHEFPVTETGEGFNVRDLGDGVRAITTTTKMGTYNPAVCRALTAWLNGTTGPLVLTSEAKHFSLGFDLRVFSEAMAAKDMDMVNDGLLALQGLADTLSKKQVVAAIFGYTLGGGLEMAMGCPQVIAHSESMIGLPEVRVGLLPGGAGTCELRRRAGSNLKLIAHYAKSAMSGAVTTNAFEGFGLGYLRASDVIAPHSDRLLHDAKQLALNLQVQEPAKWEMPEGPLVGVVDRVIDELKTGSDWAPYDEHVCEAIKWTMTKPGTWTEAVAREREEFVKLCQHGNTVLRVQHMLDVGKPLRN
ncbi:MAG: enoyl-CoA hydratase/isomerase family protein [Chthonomonas sp.]|nr:enoyl-CoA hydratase/isomerase family protein [Chthonomonas sp.]